MSRRGFDWIWATAAMAVMVWLYGWSVSAVHGLGPPSCESPPNDYYNHLVAGFVDGHLYMDLPVSDGLKALADPYDPRQNEPYRRTDASYYKGHYYLYFGPTPAVTVLLPFRLLTGRYLPTPWAMWFLVSVGFISAALTFMALRARYFADAPGWTAPIGVLVLGVGSMADVLLRRPFFWELATAGGVAFAMLAFGAVYRAIHVERRRAAWMAAAGVLLGLAVASRPTYVYAVPMLALPLLAAAQSGGIDRRWWQMAVAGAAGIGAMGVAVFAYNYARFGNGLEFGHNYLLSVAYESKVRLFGWDHFWFNVRMYFLLPGQWSWHPPFFAPVPVTRAEMPPGFYTVDDPYGLLRVFPITLLALAAPLALTGRAGAERVRLRAVLIAAAVLFGTAAVVILLYVATIPRYAVDFLPALMLLVAVGILAIVGRSRPSSGPEGGSSRSGPPGGRALPANRFLQVGRVLRVAVAAVAVISLAVGTLTIFDLGRLVSETHPDAMARISRVTSRLEWLQDQARGIHYGPVELRVVFKNAAGYGDPALHQTSEGDPVGQDRSLDRLGTLSPSNARIPPDRIDVGRDLPIPPVRSDTAPETLLTAGDRAQPDRVLVEHTSARQVRLGIQHANDAPQWSAAVDIDPAATHTIRVELGSFYPTVEHGFFARAGYQKASWLRHRAELKLDRRSVLRTFAPFEPSRRGAPRQADPAFTGRVVSVIQVPAALGSRTIDAPDNRFIAFTAPAAPGRYPLLTSGEGTGTDCLFLDTRANGRGRIGYEHGAAEPIWSGEFELAAGSRHTLELRQTERGWALPADGGRLLVAWLDGRLICNTCVPAFRTDTDHVITGRNPGGVGGITAAFEGLKTTFGPPTRRGPGGTLLLRVIMPKGVKNAWVPLLCTGHSGAADTLSIDYMGADEIQFRFDHWAAPLVIGKLAHVDESVGHDLEIAYPSFAPSAFGKPAHGEVVVRFDGQEVLRAPSDAFGFTPAEFSLGENRVHASLVDPYFRGAFIQRDWAQE